MANEYMKNCINADFYRNLLELSFFFSFVAWSPTNFFVLFLERGNIISSSAHIVT